MRNSSTIMYVLVFGIYVSSCQHYIDSETTKKVETLAKVDIAEQLIAHKEAVNFIYGNDFSGLNRSREDDRKL